jgi:RNA polymerase sigma-70 factor, ECF subfamily
MAPSAGITRPERWISSRRRIPTDKAATRFAGRTGRRRRNELEIHSYGQEGEDDERLHEIVDGFVDAWERADVDAVVAMLASDVAMTMPPLPTWYRGRDAVAAFLEGWPLRGERRWRLVPVRANAQLAFGHYVWDEERETFTAHSITVIALDGERIADITAFLDAELLPRFGLPIEIEP